MNSLVNYHSSKLVFDYFLKKYLVNAIHKQKASQVALVVKNPPASTADVRDTSLIPGSGTSPEEHSNPLQYSCLESPMDRGAWWATDHGVTKSWTRLEHT